MYLNSQCHTKGVYGAVESRSLLLEDRALKKFVHDLVLRTKNFVLDLACDTFLYMASWGLPPLPPAPPAGLKKRPAAPFAGPTKHPHTRHGNTKVVI